MVILNFFTTIIQVEGDENHHHRVVRLLQDMFELVTNDLLINGSRLLKLYIILLYKMLNLLLFSTFIKMLLLFSMHKNIGFAPT